ncbi:hypothetical protein LTS08_005665 [Lithohypha guttulata]|uniref:uncharacterized protein n=1 Tax=Lithohypha guttulata TaxID=1690604 RepID=UPI002DDEF5F5|nr:hypothetical protein LTR51_003165 [Lithohypha guttulata]KAK5099950.1 hypothetical protein LTS08_005665 [Lithohypha guttulata]
MKFRETIRSPRLKNESELLPYVLGADPGAGPYTTNITMEMVDMIASPLTPVFAIPPNSPNKIPEAKTGTTETEAKIRGPASKPLALHASGPNDTLTSPYPSPQYHSKRPAPINVNNRAPAKLEQSTCDISDTPFSQLNMAAYTFRELTYWNQRRQSTLSHRTAKTPKSSFIFGWWK